VTTDPQTFRHRGEQVEAVQWTGDNADVLRAFAGPDFDEIDLDDRTEDPDETAAVRESEHGTWRGLKPGDWVVRLDGGLYEFAADDFAKQYEPMPVAPAAAPPTGQTGLRDLITEALIAWTYRGKDPEHGGILETVRANAYSRADAVLAVLPAPVDQADDADRRAYAWAQTVDTDDGDIYIPGVHSSGTGLEAVAIVVHREDIPVLAGMLAEAGGGPVDRGFVLAEAERQFLAFALDLAADQMASRGDEFGDEDTAALDTLRRLAAETVGPETQGAQLPCQCSHGEAYHDFKYGGPRCRLCPESGEWTWRHAFRSATAPAVVAEPGKEA
jgi:hypothetical protein